MKISTKFDFLKKLSQNLCQNLVIYSEKAKIEEKFDVLGIWNWNRFGFEIQFTKVISI